MAEPHPSARTPRALSIAGSDSGGGAGIQADLKAFAACGVHGTTALTAVTAQSTVGVDAIHPVPPEVILAQVRAVGRDIGVDAVKIGMLGDRPTIEAVARALDELAATGGNRARRDGGAPAPVVLDPVMVAESGAALLRDDAQTALLRLLLPRITVITPNLPEARRLTGRDTDDAAELARALHGLGVPWVVVTGGHRATASDVVFDGVRLHELTGARHPDGAAHGSGCTHSSVLAARLARGDDPLTAARVAKQRAAAAVRDGLLDVGEGPGPVDVLGIRGLAS